MTNRDEEITHRTHGGAVERLAEEAGLPEDKILDFSANLNPEGPPPWLGEAAREALRKIGRYPDPEARRAVRACARRYGLSTDRVLFGNGADDLLIALPRALGPASIRAFPPTYSGYLRMGFASGLPPSLHPTSETDGFNLDPGTLDAILARADAPALVLIGRPNNPAGAPLPAESLEDLARAHPRHYLCADESFVELARGVGSLLETGRALPDNLIVLRSLTKTLAVPGARIGFLVASPDVVRAVRSKMQSWPVNCLAEEIAVRAFSDTDFLPASAARVADYRKRFSARLASIPGVRPEPGFANFLLLRIDAANAREVAASALRRGVAFRTYDPNEGLDGSRWLRAAVRGDGENARAAEALQAAVREAGGNQT